MPSQARWAYDLEFIITAHGQRSYGAMENVHIDLGENSYDIVIGSHLPLGPLMRQALPKGKDLLVVSNETVAPLYLAKVISALQSEGFKVKSCILPDGECYKNIESYMQIMTALLEEGFGRDCCLVALGGGVVGDITGFAASSYQRGVDFVQIPTTLLAMVDSSVGGKTAINHPMGKNMIGAFYQPKIVLSDLEFLKTLPEREVAAGMAEVIKYGVIMDEAFFEYLEQAKSVVGLDLGYVVKRCCECKAYVVGQDEKEKGLRALLNYGHTFGHAIEVGMGFGNYLHGEAVAVGMLIAAYVALKSGKGLTEEQYQRICAILPGYKLPTTIPSKLSAQDFIAHMRHDKKVKQGKINYVLPSAIGKSAVFNDLSDETIVELISQLHA